MPQPNSWNGKKVYCYRCDYNWIARGDKKPRFCPRCRSSRYGVPISRNRTCQHCGHNWVISDYNEKCPNCGKGLFDDLDSMKHHCNQCDHVWTARVNTVPQRCPLCGSFKWNSPKINKFVCHKCGHVWTKKVERPLRCPNCQSPKWNEITFKLQCRRCGHKWMSNNSKGVESVKICPSCKSTKWNETPQLNSCQTCGSVYLFNGNRKRCPKCSSIVSKNLISHHCDFCGMDWCAQKSDTIVCPRCGIFIASKDGVVNGTIDLWSEGPFKLTYNDSNNTGCIYLWNENYPESAMNLPDLLNSTGLPLNAIIERAHNEDYSDFWKDIITSLHEHREDYKEDIPYFKKRLCLDDDDSEILSLHFLGMGPEAISIRMGTSIKEVIESFNRIMNAYSEGGIIVNDSVYTDDPFSEYDKQRLTKNGP